MTYSITFAGIELGQAKSYVINPFARVENFGFCGLAWVELPIRPTEQTEIAMRKNAPGALVILGDKLPIVLNECIYSRTHYVPENRAWLAFFAVFNPKDGRAAIQMGAEEAA